ncbi:MAG: glycerol-3-phosphate dehydrogenase/oxidase [Cyanobacteria bacterium P01_F01_bin.42]
MRSQRSLSNLAQHRFDLIVIGGGINGAGTARDAAMRGLKTLLLDKGDFGGAVGWSSRLIHGGLRYLEYLEFNLVRESLRERERLLSNSPHLVTPLQMTIPIYQESQRGPQLLRLGMILYDVLSFDKTLPAHRMLRKVPFAQLFRGVNSDRLVGAAQYFDAQVEYAEQLCLENVLSAQAAGATVLNYASVTRLIQPEEGGSVTQIVLTDQLTGEAVELDTSQAILVNTAGSWVDQVCERGWQGDHPAPLSPRPLMGGTKGSHIIVDPFPGAPTETALYVEAETDGRPYFIIPWLGKYLIGTTDLRYTDSLDQVKASDEEIDYLLTETNRVLPQAQIRREDVRFTYSGVRPLPYVDTSGHKKKNSSITRSHIVHDHSTVENGGISNFISLVGGKLTTYRQVGEELTNIAYRKLGVQIPMCKTRSRPLPGGKDYSAKAEVDAVNHYRGVLSVETVEHLFNLYGMRMGDVLSLVERSPDLAERLQPELPDIRAQVVYAVEREMARTLVDIGFRRLLIAHRANYGRDALPAIVETLQEHCGWSPQVCERQMEDYSQYLKTHAIPDYQLGAESKKMAKS